jgi:signal transduction histidine kinase
MTSSHKTTLAFLIFGVLWIFLTDRFLLLLSGNDLSLFSKIQTYKGILFVSLSAALIYLVSYYLNKKLNTSNQDLKISNQKLFFLLEERVKSQKQIAEAIIKAQEQERKQLGQELHDNINQILATTKLYLDIAKDNPSMQQDLMVKSGHNINEVISELRKLSKSLTPPSLGEIGLIASIEDLLTGIIQAGRLDVSFYHDSFSENQLAPEKQLIVYRIVQEQINNVIRHAEARNVIIELENDNRYVNLSIQDDGIGFDPKKPSAGIGLKNIRNRAELYNGCITIDTAPGEGCVLHVRFEL